MRASKDPDNPGKDKRWKRRKTTHGYTFYTSDLKRTIPDVVIYLDARLIRVGQGKGQWKLTLRSSMLFGGRSRYSGAVKCTLGYVASPDVIEPLLGCLGWAYTPEGWEEGA